MSTNATDSYAEACLRAATDQGLDVIRDALQAAGITVQLEQTGGFCMALSVACSDPRYYVMITDAELFSGDTGCALICLYDSQSDDSEEIADDIVPFADVVPAVRKWVVQPSDAR